ncbi:unnamed protein product [Parnassius mnemosyne]|uniref:Uncharacterized protein n=1 Tax=Parnassius mnemosyne TaxID=213953 RepID=A0AAV1K938_9NEOP
MIVNGDRQAGTSSGGGGGSGGSGGSGSGSSRATPTSRAPPKHAAPARAPPRLHAHPITVPEKRAAVSSAPSVLSSSATSTPTVSSGSTSAVKSGALSYTGAIVGARGHTFAAKVTAAPAGNATPNDTKPRPLTQGASGASGASGAAGAASSPGGCGAGGSPLRARSSPLERGERGERGEDEPRRLDLSPDAGWAPDEPALASAPAPAPAPAPATAALHINTQPQGGSSGSGGSAQEYSLFKDLSAGAAAMWGAGDAHHNVDPPPPQVDASKAPGYRGGGAGAGGCSPCSRASSHGSTPPPAYAPPAQPAYHTPLPIGPPPHQHAHQQQQHPQHAPQHQPQHAQHPQQHQQYPQQHQPPHQPQHPPASLGNTVNAMDLSGLSRNGPIYQQDNSRNGHNMMPVSMSGNVGMSGAALGLGYVGVENVSRLNPRAPDFAQRHPLLQHKHSAQLFAGGNNAGNLSTLLMSYQQPTPKPMQHTPQPHHPYQSLLERGVGVGVGVNVSSSGGVGGVGGAGGAGGAGSGCGWGEEEERKPRPIGTERAWKLTGGDDWPHAHLHHPHLPDHDRYQGVSGMGGVGVGVGVGMGAAGALEGAYGGGATAAALSLMHALPLHYLPPDHQHWDQQPHPHPHPHHAADKQQAWSKWTH